MKYNHTTKLALCILATGAAIAATADEVKLEWKGSGMMELAGGYRPILLQLSEEKPASLKKAPDGLSAGALYGVIEFGPTNATKKYCVIVDEPEGKPAHLYVDSNGNGDLTDDPAPEWKTEDAGGPPGGPKTVIFQGGADLESAYEGENTKVHLGMYRFDKTDPKRKAYAMRLFYYRDYGRTGTLSLAGKSYKAMLLDDATSGDFRLASGSNMPGTRLMIDLNGDGKFQRQEAFAIDKPFNIGGTTYEIAKMTPSGSSFAIEKSSKTVEETMPVPSLAKGSKALPFEAKATTGESINFPDTYKGKIVLLDFWATWCGPCKAELPNVVAAYEKYHSKGFDIVSVSLDQPKDGEKLAAFTKEHNMPWPEIYDGKYWKAEVAQKYFIDSIPHAFLVDGSTGMILAEGDEIRGDKLDSAISAALPKL